MSFDDDRGPSSTLPEEKWVACDPSRDRTCPDPDGPPGVTVPVQSRGSETRRFRFFTSCTSDRPAVSYG